MKYVMGIVVFYNRNLAYSLTYYMRQSSLCLWDWSPADDFRDAGTLLVIYLSYSLCELLYTA